MMQKDFYQRHKLMQDYKMKLFTNRYHQNIDLPGSVFLVTGGAGFIGSNIVEYLIEFGAGKVIVLDNFSTGKKSNLERWLHLPNFELIEGDIRDLDTCRHALSGVNYVLHQAALGSVPRSVKDPLTTNSVNISGFLNILTSAKDCKDVKRLVFAASSSTYGDHPGLPKIENKIGSPLSPYAVTKLVNELYADVFSRVYSFSTIGLRYFNVFGPNQNPDGEYAAVIPRFIRSALNNEQPLIFGDGEQTRDFTFVSNVVQANIRALEAQIGDRTEVFNIACGFTTSLNQLWQEITSIEKRQIVPLYSGQRTGDVRKSLADISKAQALLNYSPEVHLNEGLWITYNWFKSQNGY